MDFMEQNFTHAAGDVWVVTYQKAGTTWTQFIVTLLIGHPPLTNIWDLFGPKGTCPWPEIELGPLATPAENLELSATSGEKHRCLKSHWPRRDFLTQLPSTSKVIYVMRGVESIVLSYWHHLFTMYFYYGIEHGTVSFDDYFKKFIYGDVENGDYFEHVASWWNSREDPNLLIVRYEDLKRDPVAIVKTMSNFIGVPVSDARVAEIVAATDFKVMQSLMNGAFDQFLKWVGAVRGDHIRKGGSGEKEQLISPAQRASLVKRFDEVLRPLGMPEEYMFEAS